MHHPTLALLIFVLTYLSIAAGERPRLRLDRPGAARAGAGLVVALGVVDPETAYRAVNIPTLTLLLGMMVITGYLRAAGLFRWMAAGVLRAARTPRVLLWMTVLASGALSALFVNDTVCLLLTPLLLAIADAYGLPPVPYLLALAIGSNAGSVITPIGNPQNMLIASLSGIPFHEFSGRLLVPGLLAMAATGVVLDVAYGRRLPARFAEGAPLRTGLVSRRLAWFGAAVTAVVLGALLAGVSPPVVALGGAAVFLIGAGIRPERIYATVDWTLLLLFAGLFVVTGAFEDAGWSRRVFDAFHVAGAGAGAATGLGAAAGASAAAAPAAGAAAAAPGFVAPFVLAVVALSNLVSNVPAVLVVKPLIQHVGSPQRLWLLLALVSTLAGNLTLVGSVANLIVVQKSRHRVRIGFGEYLRVGAWVTLLSIAAGVGWLLWLG